MSHCISDKLRDHKHAPNASALESMKNIDKEPITAHNRDPSGLREAHPNTIKCHDPKHNMDAITELDMNTLRNHLDKPDKDLSDISYKSKTPKSTNKVKKTYRVQ